MQLRKARISLSTATKSGLFLLEDAAPLLCWRDTKPCTSNCAAWRIMDNILTCMALPKDQRVVNIITDKE